MRSRTLFLLAILMGFITTILFVLSMKTHQPESAETVEFTEVIFAAAPIKENQVITDEMVELRKIPENQKHESAIQKKEDVIGKIATAQIEIDEIILLHRVQTIEEERVSVSKKIREGFRGVSIAVNIVQSVSNLVEPEDKVDVILTKKEKQEDEEPKSTVIFSEIRVLAIGQKITMLNEIDEIVTFTEVTLEISSEDTEALVNAHETGSLHLVLHSRIINE